MELKPSPVTLATSNRPSFLRLEASVGATWCMTSMSPERRLASRTLSSGMMRNTIRSNFATDWSK